MSDRKSEANSVNFLSQLVGKTVAEIFYVDYNNDRENDGYLPWLIFITFEEFDKYLEIEGDLGDNHIKITLPELSKLNPKLKENDFPNELDHWKVYKVEKSETLGKLLNQQIQKSTFGLDKDEFEINGERIKGQKDGFTFLRLFFENSFLTIFEWQGLMVSEDPIIEIPFEDTFNSYEFP